MTVTLDEQAALDRLQATIDELFDPALKLIPFTRDNFLALIRSALGTPYLYGGIDPFNGGADCSGLVYWACGQCGYAAPRTTEAEWADLPRVASPQPGDLVEFDVPADGSGQPAHVGVYVAPGTMIDDPYTGAVVRQEGIPNVPGSIWPIGYVRLPFIAPTPPPPPPPPPQEEEMQISAFDPKTSGNWVTDENGALYCDDGAPFIAGLNQHPEYHAGTAESGGANPCVAIEYWAALGNDGIKYVTRPTTGKGGWAGTPYSLYRFLRNGNAALSDGTVMRPHPTKAGEWEPTGEKIDFSAPPEDLPGAIGSKLKAFVMAEVEKIFAQIEADIAKVL